ncbi:adenylate/guanylate cyclase domain-containing protein [Actinocatenispora comari]|uniref:Adenylate cyclase n=1 Tax=Actinocatenispora comari TaxID=2807577 RepID=A0A8J4AIA4_9ACTN|nr:adenylate/guanylate cyclase domain-containing protein [Actinocatenispora comari]GIL31708.1 adenylate cyclase [Actinocatenispora comari]
MTCPVCGTVAVPGARYCHHCGSRLPTVAAAPATERRVVTILFGDLSDFTAWSEDLDPERVSSVTDRVLAAFAGAVTTFGGHVDKLTGDGIMAVFGAPVAHEDDPDRAVRAALAMQRAVRRVLDAEQGGGVPLGLRVGLNTGQVVAGVQANLEYTVIGDAVNTAARLADAAQVGTVYAGSTTYHATRQRAAWRRLPPLRLKGKREPVETYELLGLRDAPGTRSGLGDEAPFIGREPEAGRFDGRLNEVIDRGQPRTLVMTAEAGVGKSRFAAEAGRRAAEHGARVLSVRCEAYGERRRLAPLADLVRQAAGLSREDGSPRGASRSTAQSRLYRLAAKQPGDAPRLPIDLLLALLGHGDLPNRMERPAGTSGDAGEAIPAAVADLLNVLAAESPLVLVVDDVHDATSESLAALGAMISRLTGPVLVLLLGRPELTRTAGLLSRIPDAELAPLPALRGEDASRLLRAYLSGGSLSAADEGRLLATAQGNPFYLAELVTLLMERGRLVDDDEPGEDGRVRWSLAAGSLGGRLLSRDLAAVLAARIDALSPTARTVLRDAAVVGDTVPLSSLSSLEPELSDADEDKAMDDLVARNMLRRTGRDEFTFTTPLMREAAYAGIGKADLADRHARLARWAAQRVHSEGTYSPADGETLGDDAFVAEHAEKAVLLADEVGLRDDADARSVAPLGAAALSRMAGRALEDGEPGRTVELAGRAARVAGGTGGGSLPVADRLVRAQALLQLGRANDAREEAEQVAAGAISDVVRIDALLLAGDAYRTLGNREQARASWRAALQAAGSANLPQQRAATLCKLAMSDYLSGRFAEAEEQISDAYKVSQDAGDKRNQAWALQYLAWVTTSRGDFAGADGALGRAAKLFAELDDDTGRTWVRGTTAFGRMLAGRLTEADKLARAFLPFGERVGDTWAVGTLRSVAAFASAELGRLAEAERIAQRAYQDFELMGDDWGRGLALVARAMVARGAGQVDQAVELLTEAERFGEKTSHPLLLGMSRTIRGFCQLDRSDPVAAERDARATLDLVEPYDVVDSARVGPMVLLAEARRAQGDLPAALRLLDEIDADPDRPVLLLSRQQAGAIHASALLCAGRTVEAVDRARAAVDSPAEDVRSGVLAHAALARCLAAAGNTDCARHEAQLAAEAAYATEQTADRARVDGLLAELPG